mmetsp:Transcript_785/g.1177  ORF Transcript_785/g.1177 Transcript_785/m.1177 type:complete len:347 (+) Transcript_785:2985-4025(+)
METKVVEGMWIQGDQSFVESIFNEVKNQVTNVGEITVVISDLTHGSKRPCLPERKIVWSRISHVKCGGVTDGVWDVGSTVEYKRDNMTASHRVQRVLGHILKCTVEGISCGKPKVEKRERGRDTYLSGVNFIPIGKESVQVIAPYIKIRSGCIKRFLNLDKLSDIYNLQGTVVKQMSSSDESGTWINNVVKACPEKVLHWVTALVLENFVGETTNDVTKGTMGCEQLENIQHVTLMDYGEHLGGKVNESDLKAAKDDDALADSSMWDKFSLRSYLGSDLGLCPTKIPSDCNSLLVCQGGELGTHHEHLFEGLRLLGIRRYRGNLLISFKRHLERKYGPKVLEIWRN